MKNTVPRVAALLGLVAALCVNSAMGQMVPYRSVAPDGLTSPAVVATDSTPFVAESPAGPVPPAAAVPPPAPVLAGGDGCCACNTGCGCGCDSGCGCCGCGLGCGKADCDQCPGIGIETSFGVQCWRSVVDSELQNNAGPIVSANVGVPIPVLREFGIGAQAGVSYAAADLDGRENISTDGNDSRVQQQTFFTVGLFRRAFDSNNFNSRFSVGIAYDWMLNNEYGLLAQSPTLGQWRGQIGYCLSACNEIGIWGTHADRNDDNGRVSEALILYRPLSQINLFWHHTFCSGANCWLSIGMPEHVHTVSVETFGAGAGDNVVTTTIRNDGSLGEYTLGATFIVPISNCWALYANGSYMRPTAGPGPWASEDDAYSIGFGLTFYPGGNARTRTVAGNCWMPYLPVANNGSFLVDSNL